MQLVRPSVAAPPRLFGRRQMRDPEASAVAHFSLSDDVKLFALTFVAGFLFVSILIG